METQLPQKRDTAPQFSSHVYCGQTAAFIRISLGTEVGLGPGDIALDGAQLPPTKKGHIPQFSAHVYCGQTVAHLSYCWALVIPLYDIEEVSTIKLFVDVREFDGVTSLPIIFATHLKVKM